MFLAWFRRWWSSSADSLGKRGEDRAARYLAEQGYRIVERRVRLSAGEIDLVALDGRTIVFVEVKTRSSIGHGVPTDAVDGLKQRRLTQAALAYLKQGRLLDRPARFDVVSIVWRRESDDPEIRHIRSAFEAVGRNGMYS